MRSLTASLILFRAIGSSTLSISNIHFVLYVIILPCASRFRSGEDFYSSFSHAGAMPALVTVAEGLWE
ncbi:hypothetical protein SAMN06269301_3365 [Geobacter sp. DSM 9736]|nr:hypothetical protein SAMN06269301_3365 [Geobacter sp. DSM 9736]